MNKRILIVLLVILGITLAIGGHTMYKKNQLANRLRDRGATIHNPYIYKIGELKDMEYGNRALSGSLKDKMNQHNDYLR